MRKLNERPSSPSRIQETVEFTGKVSKLFYKSPDFSTGVLDTDEGKVKFAGAMMVDEGDQITITGVWSKHDKYGDQIKVESFSYNQDLEAAGLVDFLSKSKAFHGIGKSRAEKLAGCAVVTEQGFEAAIQNPEALAASADVSVEVATNLRDEWNKRVDQNRAMVGLSAYGISPGRSARLFKRFGSSILRIVEQDPYFLIGKVPQMGFKTIDAIATKVGIAKDHPSRIESSLLFELSEHEDQGHTWTDMETLISGALQLLALDNMDADLIVRGSLARMIGEQRVVSVQTKTGFACWDPRMHAAESFVTKTIAENGNKVAGPFAEWTKEDVQRLQPMLTDEQAVAVLGALRTRLSVITGGAGVGKTFTIATVKEACSEKGMKVGMCAPTGKAARRMQESTGHAALTIHRLLEPVVSENDVGDMLFHFDRGSSNPLELDLLIVDEVSMVDVRLFSSLFAAIDFRRTQVVLVGDYNQLPPVGPGAVLRDLVNGGPCKVSKLMHVHRNAGALRENVYGVLDGKVAPSMAGKTKVDQLLPWYVFGHLAEPADLVKLVTYMFATRIPELEMEDPKAEGGKRKIDPVWDCQLLTPMHKGPIGTIEMNIALQRVAQERAGRTVPPPKPSGKPHILVGDKVMQTRNNYDLGVMNGTVGRVVMTDEKAGEWMVEFDGTIVKVEGENRQDISLAYAMTVHKAQGSEFPVTVFVCSKSHRIMHHRGLFYTAVSRARKSAVIIGDRWGINACAFDIRIDARRTMLSLVTAGEKIEVLTDATLSACAKDPHETDTKIPPTVEDETL